MTEQMKNILVVALTTVILMGFGVAMLLLPAKNESAAERRPLEQMPAVTGQTLADGTYMDAFEQAAMDQFPLRDTLRSVKAVYSRYALQQKDNHGIYLAQGHLSKLEYPMSMEMLNRGAAKVQSIYDTYLSGTDCKIYLSIVPDKNCFLAEANGYPAMDYEAATAYMRQKISFAEYIDIFPLLTLDDYYRTDQHWRQEVIGDVAKTLADAMGVTIDDQFTEYQLERPFYGTYWGQAALPVQPDTIQYLTSALLDGCTVTTYRNGSAAEGTMYDLKRAGGRDAYDLFLSGADPLVEIENPQGEGELVIFRDSFGSSLAPLLASGYGKIMLVDLRYLRSDLLGQYLTFDQQDVLFLYSTLILNHSIVLQ